MKISETFLIVFIIASALLILGEANTKCKKCSKISKKYSEKCKWCTIEKIEPQRDEDEDEGGIIPITSPTPPTQQPEFCTGGMNTVPEVCFPYNKEKADFKAPGQRISITKCKEYVWDSEQRFVGRERERECRSIKSKMEVLLKEGRPQILGGQEASIEEFPHMGAIGWQSVEADQAAPWQFLCGGSLISPKFVLTAGHCTYFHSRTVADPEPKVVRFGTSILATLNFRSQPVDVNISKIIKHPEYKPPSKYFDIALIELVEEIEFSLQVQPACLWTEEVKLKEGSICGWGVTAERQQLNEERHLMKASVNIVDSETCDALLKPSCSRHWCGLKDHQFCAGKLEGGVDSCQGDSGGPLQVSIPLRNIGQGFMYNIIGVVSFGIGCGRENSPGVYVKVSSFLDWIEPIVWANETLSIN